MKRFNEYISEEVNPTALTKQGVIDIRDSAVRDNLNALLNGATACRFISPYVALEKVSKVLANYHIFLPKHSFMEGDSGIATFELNQFGKKMGMTDDGRVVTAEDNDYSIFFEYRMTDSGMFDIFCEVVDQEELDEILSDIDDEMEDEEDELNEETTYDKFVKGAKSPRDMTDAELQDRLKKPARKGPGSATWRKLLRQEVKRRKHKKIEEENLHEISDKMKKEYRNAASKDISKIMGKVFKTKKDMKTVFKRTKGIKKTLGK